MLLQNNWLSFGVSKSTIRVVTKNVCSFIVKYLLPKYIKYQQKNLKENSVEALKAVHGFRQFIGAIDGTHFAILSQ